MQIVKNKNHKIRNIIVLAVLIATLAIGAFYVYSKRSDIDPTNRPDGSTGGINYDKATKDQSEAGAKIKNDNAKANADDKAALSPPTSGSAKKNVQVTITAANQNGSTLQIRTLISVVENTGTCALTFTRTGQPTVTKTAGAQALASSSTCQGFDTPTSELSTGTWQALIVYESETSTGSATKTITIH